MVLLLLIRTHLLGATDLAAPVKRWTHRVRVESVLILHSVVAQTSVG